MILNIVNDFIICLKAIFYWISFTQWNIELFIICLKYNILLMVFLICHNFELSVGLLLQCVSQVQEDLKRQKTDSKFNNISNFFFFYLICSAQLNC